jgi:hypothetical protein
MGYKQGLDMGTGPSYSVMVWMTSGPDGAVLHKSEQDMRVYKEKEKLRTKLKAIENGISNNI